MGSGHFLVSLVDWLADEVLRAMAEAQRIVDWGAMFRRLPAASRTCGAKILAEATKSSLADIEGQLDDRHVVRRMVLKRVVYGVDKNPMAVELAKVALMAAFFHSRRAAVVSSIIIYALAIALLAHGCAPTVDALQKRGALFNLGEIARVERVSRADDRDRGDHRQRYCRSRRLEVEMFGAVEDVTEPDRRLVFSARRRTDDGRFRCRAEEERPTFASSTAKRTSRSRRLAPIMRAFETRRRTATRARRHLRQSDAHRQRRGTRGTARTCRTIGFAAG